MIKQSLETIANYVFIGGVIMLGILFHVHGALKAVRLETSSAMKEPLDIIRSNAVPEDRC